VREEEVPDGTPLSRAELAGTAGVDEAEIDRLVDAWVLVERDTPKGPFRAVDVLKIRVARACEEGGLPIEAMAAAIKKGRLSFAFPRDLAVRSRNGASRADTRRAGGGGRSAL
jgi:hypothetical protein